VKLKTDGPNAYLFGGLGVGLYVGLLTAACVGAWLAAWWFGIIVTAVLLGFTVGLVFYLREELKT